jgi:POT family proton-dependent oligopeptide transporter
MNMDIYPTEDRAATEDEIKTLRHVVGSLPLVAWIALAVSGAERFTFYAVTTPWREYQIPFSQHSTGS